MFGFRPTFVLGAEAPNKMRQKQCVQARHALIAAGRHDSSIVWPPVYDRKDKKKIRYGHIIRVEISSPSLMAQDTLTARRSVRGIAEMLLRIRKLLRL